MERAIPPFVVLDPVPTGRENGGVLGGEKEKKRKETKKQTDRSESAGGLNKDPGAGPLRTITDWMCLHGFYTWYVHNMSGCDGMAA
jgi:hypothetical protein